MVAQNKTDREKRTVRKNKTKGYQQQQQQHWCTFHNQKILKVYEERQTEDSNYAFPSPVQIAQLVERQPFKLISTGVLRKHFKSKSNSGIHYN